MWNTCTAEIAGDEKPLLFDPSRAYDIASDRSMEKTMGKGKAEL